MILQFPTRKPQPEKQAPRANFWACTLCDGYTFRLTASGGVNCAGCGMRMQNLYVILTREAS